jgi:hypothetical protein
VMPVSVQNSRSDRSSTFVRLKFSDEIMTSEFLTRSRSLARAMASPTSSCR